jgi:hypothetical protein
LSRRDVAGSVWRFCRAAQFPVVGTAGVVAAGHREAFHRISIPGQGEDVASDQGSAKVLTFDLSIPLLKHTAAVGRMFWWKSLAGDVATYVSTCVACQRNKARRRKPYGLLQPLPVPEKPWHTVTFDFIVKLPKASRGNDSVCVFVDKLTKLVHFVACKEEVSAKEFVELYVDHVFCLHGLSREFITDRDSRFTSAFWQDVTVLLGTRTVMSSSFHPQTDGQTERVNQTLETYLRHFVSVGLNDWDTLLSRAEFAHNAAINETIRAAPFE